MLHMAWREPNHFVGNTTMLLLLANLDNAPRLVRLGLRCRDQVDCSKPVLALFQQGRQLQLDAAGEFTDVLVGFGTAAYRVSLHRNLPRPPTSTWQSDAPGQKTPIVPNSHNLVVNPSFEQAYNAGSPDGYTYSYACSGGSRTDGFQHCADGSATAFTDPRTAVHGTHSLRLTTPSAGHGMLMVPYEPGQPLRFNAKYHLSFWTRTLRRPSYTDEWTHSSIRTPLLSFTFSASFINSSTNVSILGGGEWQRHSLNLHTVSSRPRKASGWNWVRWGLVSASTVWVDLFELVLVKQPL